MRPVLTAVLLGSGCTFATNVNDYKVDPQVEVRDLNFTLSGMGAHEGQQLDVAVVAQAGGLMARAIVLLRPATSTNDYPDEQIVMDKALIPGAQEVYFFVDNSTEICTAAQKVCPDGARLCMAADKICPDSITQHVCGEFQGGTSCRDGQVQVKEHSWIKPVNPDGSLVFPHSTQFQRFTTADYQVPGNDFVIRLGDAELVLFNKALEQHNLELHLTLISEERQVGLFRAYKRTRLFGDIRLAGIIDAGNDYRLESVVDGVVTKTATLHAPQGEADLEIALKEVSISPKK